MDWARTLRMDAPPSDALRERITQACAREGASARFADDRSLPRTYALIEGPRSADPAQLQGRFPEGRWYPDAIIALAIEPFPADALPALADALGGPGAPSGVLACERAGCEVVVEFDPARTRASFIFEVADVELARMHGSRRTRLLSPLSRELAARVAAEAMQAGGFDAEQVLETQLERAHVE